MPEAPLSSSAAAALRWAALVTVARGETYDGPDHLDLLAGVALAHLRDSPAQALFDHFGLPFGGAFTALGPRRVTAGGLLAAAAATPERSPRPNSKEVERVLADAARLPPDPDGLLTLDMLFGALLESSNPASDAIRALLAGRGEDAAGVVASYRDYLGSRVPYAEFLREHHPRRPLELAPYAADEPVRRDPADGGTDLVGVTAETDAFAYLIASRRLVPPLAVGLFGDWGSGKSYFLRRLQRRIDEITGTGGPAGPFHSSVVQIEFNAWQYVEGDLWASLLEHLFRNLRTSPDDSDDLLGRRHRYWIGQIDENARAQLAARDERAALEREQNDAAAEVGRSRAERVVALAELERRQRERPLAGWRPSPELVALRDRALAEAGLTGVATEATGLAAELERSAESIREAGVLLAPIRARGWRFVAALVAVLVATPLVAYLLGLVDLSGVSAAAGTVAWLLATGAGYLKVGNDALHAGLGAVRAAQAQLTAETDAARTRLDERIRAAEDALAAVTAKVGAAATVEADLARRSGELAATLAAVTPAGVLTEFIAERTGSEDYRERLGLPAVVRRDLERLSRLVAEQGRTGGGDGEHAIDRVVLYIDDLDRCPTDLVIKVLEAVHLLLAFPLFVVVVAVDARWLESSLLGHYPQLRGPGAGPADYLEKIFQVPFWVRALDPDARRRMVRGLLGPSLRAADTGPEPGPTPLDALDPLVTVADRLTFDRVVASFAETTPPDRVQTTAADLSVTATELARIEDLADLMAATPRALKRFVNIYLLVKSMGLGQGWALPPDGQVALLLALATALPTVAETITAPSGSTLGSVLNAVVPGAEHLRLEEWLDGHPAWRTLDLAGLAPWIEPVRRFTFTRREP